MEGCSNDPNSGRVKGKRHILINVLAKNVECGVGWGCDWAEFTLVT